MKDWTLFLSHLLGMAGQAHDAACTQVKMKHVPRLLKLRETECPTIWMRLPRTRRPFKWDDIDAQRLLWKIPGVSLVRTFSNA